MSHEVESMAYVKEVPWHGLGVKVEELMTSEEALKLAGLDWEVDLRPVFTQSDSGAFIPMNDRRAVVRKTDNKPLGDVGRWFTPYQNTSCFKLGDEILGNTTGKWDTAGSLRSGASVFMSAKLEDMGMMVGGVDQIDNYLLIQNRHDGRGSLLAMLTPIRVVCMNTLQMALRGGQNRWSIRHTLSIGERADEARKALNLVTKHNEKFKVKAESLLLRPFNMDDMRKVMDTMFPKTDVPQRVLTQNTNRTDEILAVFKNSENLENVRFTAWGAWNAVTEWADHEFPFRNTKVATKAENRFASILDENGSANKLKLNAFKLIDSATDESKKVLAVSGN